VRIGGLSARTGVAVPTIRFYIREGLVPPGRLTSPNQAEYDESHVRVLKLVRSLVELGGLPLPRVRAVLAVMRSDDADLWTALGKVQYALTTVGPVVDDDVQRRAVDLAAAVIRDRGWTVRPDNPAREVLAGSIATLLRLGQDDALDMLGAYADAADRLAGEEVDDLLRRGTVESLAEGVIAYDVLGDAILSALRRLAQESEITARLGPRSR
jgi:DNA-binding transcriptional MerR regulator